MKIIPLKKAMKSYFKPIFPVKNNMIIAVINNNLRFQKSVSDKEKFYSKRMCTLNFYFKILMRITFKSLISS